MRISDWSSDVCSSDLLPPGLTLSGFTLSGTPTTTGTYSFQIVYYDSSTGPGTYFQYVPVTVKIVAAPPSIGSVTPASGAVAGGTSVTIGGTGFTGATAVTFGGTYATSFSVYSDTSIQIGRASCRERGGQYV